MEMSMPSRSLPLFGCLASVFVLAAACSSGESAQKQGEHESASASSSDYSALRDFTGIESTGPDTVIVSVGKPFAVDAHGDAKAIDALKIRVEGGKLRIGRKQGMSNFWGMGGDHGVTIRVSLPSLDSVDLTGSGDVRVDRAEGRALGLSVTGSGNLSVDAVKVTTLDADITGSGNIAMSGTTDGATLSSTGSGDLDGKGLNAAKASISITGSGNVDLSSDGSVDVRIMGSGDVDVKGTAKCSIKAMGSGEARCAA
jgi:hypothetical protein